MHNADKSISEQYDAMFTSTISVLPTMLQRVLQKRWQKRVAKLRENQVK